MPADKAYRILKYIDYIGYLSLKKWCVHIGFGQKIHFLVSEKELLKTINDNNILNKAEIYFNSSNF